MTATAKAQEPSMEEILASIRRIIADDDAPAPAKEAPKAATAKPVEEPASQGQDDIDALMASMEAEVEDEEVEDEDVLELDEQVEAPSNVPSGFKPIDGKHDLMFQEFEEPPPAREPEPDMSFDPEPVMAPPPRIVETPAFSMPDPMETLVSNATSSAVSNAFGSLAHTVLMQNARTLDDLVKEMLRPMLKQWLDDNLPTMVERLVRSEIERVSRGRPS